MYHRIAIKCSKICAQQVKINLRHLIFFLENCFVLDEENKMFLKLLFTYWTQVSEHYCYLNGTYLTFSLVGFFIAHPLCTAAESNHLQCQHAIYNFMTNCTLNIKLYILNKVLILQGTFWPIFNFFHVHIICNNHINITITQLTQITQIIF